MGMSEITVPHFLDSITDELGSRMFGGFVGGIVADPDGMFCLSSSPNDGRCIVSNKGVSWGLLQDGERGTPGVRVCSGGLNKANQVVCSILVVGYAEEEGVQDLA